MRHCLCGTVKQSGRTEIMETLGSPKDKQGSAEWAKHVPRQQEMHITSSGSVIKLVSCRKSPGGEWEMQAWWSTGGGCFNSEQRPRTYRKDYREKPVLKATCHHNLQNHCLSRTISSFPCQSLQKVPSHRALSKGETGIILTSALGLGSPTVPASRTPPAH